MASETIQLPRFTRGAADELGLEVRANSFDEAANTIDLVWSTGARVSRRSWSDGPYDEELDMNANSVRLDRLNAGAPFLNSHDSYSLDSVIGSVVPGSARIEKGKGVATVQMSRRPELAGIVGDIRDGIIKNISVGYRVHKIEKTEPKAGGIALVRVLDWEPMEISAVAIPADAGAQFRGLKASDSAALNDVVVIRADAASDPLNPAAPAAIIGDETMKNGAPAAGDTGVVLDENRSVSVVAAPAVDVAAESRAAAGDAVRAERARVAGINELARRASMSDFAQAHVEAETTVEEFRAALFDELVKKQPQNDSVTQAPTQMGVRASVGVEAAEKMAVGIENAILARYDARSFALTDHGREFRGLSIIEMGREMLAVNGARVRGMSRDEIAGQLLNRSGGMMSTSDFPAILANVASKTLRAGYEAAPQTFKPLVRMVSVPDFKPVSRIQLGEAPKLEKVGEHGQIKRGSMGDAAEKYAVATYGKIVAITRQVLVNDDLDAFTRIPRAFGVQAANLESDLVWGQILANANMADSVALFHATHGNLLTAAAISTASVGAGRTAMNKQTGLDGKTLLNITPSYLVVPSALQTLAEQFIGAIFPTKNTDTVPESLRRLQIITDPRLDNGVTVDGVAYAGSASNWYLAAEPNQIDIIELAHLEGNEGVYTETKMGFDVDGLEIKVRNDVGAKVIDWRGLAKNPN